MIRFLQRELNSLNFSDGKHLILRETISPAPTVELWRRTVYSEATKELQGYRRLYDTENKGRLQVTKPVCRAMRKIELENGEIIGSNDDGLLKQYIRNCPTLWISYLSYG